jgi:urease gamma subunit
VAPGLARERRGVRLNYPAATAVIAAHMLEEARDGRSVRGPDGGGARLCCRWPIRGRPR